MEKVLELLENVKIEKEIDLVEQTIYIHKLKAENCPMPDLQSTIDFVIELRYAIDILKSLETTESKH